MEKIKILFLGTGDIGVQLLRTLSECSGFEVVLVVTGTDKPAGRTLSLMPSPIKEVAQRCGLEVFQPEDINSKKSLQTLRNCGADMAALMAYGQLLNDQVLATMPRGFINVHASLLPHYRGASPIQSAILGGDRQTGISVMKMVRQMDAGPVYLSQSLDMSDNETSASLSEKLGQLSATLVPEALRNIFEGTLAPEEQDQAEASTCKKIRKSDGLIDWREPAEMISRRIRAFTPWPGSYTFFKGKRLKIIEASPDERSSHGEPGQVTHEGICCGKGRLRVLKVQLEGKKTQRLNDFLRGHPDFVDSILNST